MSYLTQDYLRVAVRASAVTTNSYVGVVIPDNTPNETSVILDCSKYNQLVLLLGFTIGSLTDGRVKVEFSPDNVTYYQETFATVSQGSGTSTESVGEHVYTATGNYRVLIPIADRYIKVSVKGTGTVTNSLMAVDAVLAKV